AGDEQHLLGREDDHPQDPGETSRASPQAIDPDALATSGPSRACAHDRDLDRVGSDDALDPREVGPPADELTVPAGPGGAAPGEQAHRLEQARLAGRVRAPDEVWPGPERGVEC